VLWNAPDDGGAPITGYNLFSRTTGFTNLKEVATDLAPTTRSFTHTNLLIDSTYVYFISATNRIGEGGGTTSNEVTITGTKTAPSAPGSLTAMPGGQTIINLRWTAPSNNGGTIITGYKIEVSTDGSTFTELESNTNSMATVHQHTGLPRESTRHYRVSAINSAGTSPVSNVARATTGARPARTPRAPTNLTATAFGETAIDLSWTAPSDNGGAEITGHRIELLLPS